MTEFDVSDPTIDDLATGPLDFWTEWLKGAVLAYYGPTTAANRLEAFSPLVVDPQSQSPAGDIADQLRRIGRNAVRVAPKAVSEVLFTWLLGRDKLEGALLLLELGIQLGSLNLYPGFVALLDQAALTSAEARQEISFLTAEAAAHRSLKTSEITGLIQRLGRLDDIPPTTIADLAIAYTGGNPERLELLPGVICEILPHLAESAFGGHLGTAIGRKAQFEFQEMDLHIALGVKSGEDPDVAMFRKTICQAALPGASSPEDEDDIDEETEREIFERTGISALGRGPDSKNADEDEPE